MTTSPAAAAAALAGKVARRLEETPTPLGSARARAAAAAGARARAARELRAAGPAWTAAAGGVGFRLAGAAEEAGPWPGGEPGLEARKTFPLFGGGGWRAELAAAASAARLREGHVRAAYEAPAGGGRLACDVGTDFRGRGRVALDGERAADDSWGVAWTLGAALPAGAGPASVGVAGTRRLSPRHAVLVRLFRAGPAFGDRLAVEGRFRPDPDGAGEATLALERTAGGPAPGAAVRLRARAGPLGSEAPALEVEAHLGAVGAGGGANVSFSVSCGAPGPAAPAGWFPNGV